MKRVLAWLVQLFLPHKHAVGDLVTVGAADEIFEVAGRFYKEDLTPVYILRDKYNKLREEKVEFCNVAKKSVNV